MHRVRTCSELQCEEGKDKDTKQCKTISCPGEFRILIVRFNLPMLLLRTYIEDTRCETVECLVRVLHVTNMQFKMLSYYS